MTLLRKQLLLQQLKAQLKSHRNPRQTSPERKAEESADGSVKIDNGNYTVKIVSAVKSNPDYEGKPTVLVTYEVTNNKNKNSNFMEIHTEVFQNGKSLNNAIYMDNPEGYDPNSVMTTLQPGCNEYGNTRICS